MGDDNWNQLLFFYGYKPYSDWQPIVHTWLQGTFVNIGKTIGSTNLGLFTYVLCQSIAMALILSYTIYLMDRWLVPKWYSILVLLIYCIEPYYVGNIAWPLKDYIYLIGFMLMILSIIKLVDTKDLCFPNNKKSLALWTIGILLLCSGRNNG